MTLFFTGDTHFGDPRILKIDRRPFSDLEAHDAALVARWNARVGPADTIWHLGDVGLATPPGRVAALLQELNGEKHLIVGNNDGPETLSAAGWASVGHYAEIEADGRRLVLCHYAFRTWNGMSKGAVNLHGHSHGMLSPQPRQYDVGVDAQGFQPVTLAEILTSRRRATAKRPAASTSRRSGTVSEP